MGERERKREKTFLNLSDLAIIFFSIEEEKTLYAVALCHHTHIILYYAFQELNPHQIIFNSISKYTYARTHTYTYAFMIHDVYV